MIWDSSLLQTGKPYQYKKQLWIFSHASWSSRMTKSFVFRTSRGAWKRLSRNQLNCVETVEHLREGFTE